MKKKTNTRNLIFMVIGVAITLLASVLIFRSFAYLNSDGDWNHALHFIVRHWHSVTNPDVFSNVENKQTVLEGYIVPNGSVFDFYIKEDEEEFKKVDPSKTNYVKEINVSKGIIVLNAYPYSKDGEALEKFSGFSISAGHDAVTSSSANDTLTITYSKIVHLVKSHVFYINDIDTVTGSSHSLLFNENNPEKDVDYVYIYLKDGDSYTKGDIVLDENNNPVFEEENLPEHLKDKIGTVVDLSKVYNTLNGLHTDKYVSRVLEDGRTFDIDIESWYISETDANANIGFVLDASGSMGFSANSLNVMSIYDSNLGLDKETISNLKNRAISNYVTNGKVDWDKAFLTQDELKLLLDPHKTDNSRLGVSGYSYFIYDSRTNTKDFTPLVYWDVPNNGKNLSELFRRNELIGYYTFNKGDYKDTQRDWLLNDISGKTAQKVERANLSDKSFTFSGEDAIVDWPNQPFHMVAADGYDLSAGYGNLGIGGMLLDVKPSSGDFTISFTIKRKSNTDSTADAKEIFYIGSLNQSSEDYFRASRPTGGSRNRLRVYQGSTSTSVSSINNVFNSTTPQRITYVFEDGKLTSYINGNLTEEDNNLNKDINLSDYNIIFNAFNDDYNGAEIFVDDIYVFDASLSSSDVKQLANYSSPFDTSSASNNVAYNSDGNIIGTVKDYFIPSKNNGPLTGWYYASHGQSDTFLDTNIQTAKTLYGIPSKTSLVFKDNVIIPDNGVYDSKGNKMEGGGLGYTYSPKSGVSTPMLFYIDDLGYIRCFWATADSDANIGNSYVYNMADSDYVRVESLQRAIGSFVTKLNESSPSSKVSAVRYSANSFKGNYDKLVMLDWTNDPIESTSMFSLKRGNGDGKSLDYTISKTNGLKQYNYALTGGTDVLSGLQAFKNYLLPNDEDSAKKYIVIFTDGSDGNVNTPTEPVKLANELRNEGYTIYAILLSGGTVSAGTDEYNKAKEFLGKLTGDPNLVYSTDLLENDETHDKSEALFNTVDSLVDIFTSEILSQITNDLGGYRIKDYIDPRFDIVSAANRIWHLNKNGSIVVEATDGSTYGEYNLVSGKASNNNLTITQDGTKGYYMDIAVTNIANMSAKSARLYYDSEKELYYLVWRNQTIRGSSVGANKISIWNSRITLRAKNDFIGGNAVLTNGNQEKMNYVYHSGDNTPSSGTTDMIKSPTNEYPSKGLPRVTVNVKSFNGSGNYERLLYMGESYKENLAKIINEQLKENNSSNIDYFMEYLSRYVDYSNDYDSLDTLYTAIINSGNKGLDIPYYYLPNGENQTGGSDHKKDKLGTLTFKWIEDNEYPSDGLIKDTLQRKSKISVVYTPLPINDGNENRLNYNNNILISESVYKWDNNYKKVAGTLQTKIDAYEGNITTNAVSGEIALLMELDKDVIDILKDMKGKTITYSANLLRNYGREKDIKVGTLTATYKIPDNIRDINEMILAKVTYDEEYITKYGLPIGKYTLEENKSTNTNSALLIFGTIENVEITKDNEIYFNNSDASLYPSSYDNGNETYLGTPYKGDVYINSRYALFKVSLIKNHLGSFPETGVNINYILIFNLIAFLLMGFSSLYFFGQRKKKKNKI